MKPQHLLYNSTLFPIRFIAALLLCAALFTLCRKVMKQQPPGLDYDTLFTERW
jgi:hypothetical protein